jgi:hypothetical protein
MMDVIKQDDCCIVDDVKFHIGRTVGRASEEDLPWLYALGEESNGRSISDRPPAPAQLTAVADEAAMKHIKAPASIHLYIN